MTTSLTKYAGTAPSSGGGGGGGGGAATGTATPSPLGVAAAGVAVAASHEDHVHAMPTAADVGAIPATDKGAANGVATLGNDGKVPAGQLPSSITGAMAYQGTWNASTNTPTIPVAATGNKGQYYKVSVAGATNVNGITDWQVGDWIVSNGSSWDKIDNTEQDATSSVNGNVRLAGALGGTAAAPTALGYSDAAALAATFATKADKYKGIKSISAATYTILDADCSWLLRFTNTGGCTVTIPVGLSAGFWCDWFHSVAMSGGNVTFQGDGTSGVSSIDGQLSSSGAKALGSIIMEQTNVYVVAGQLGTLQAAAISDFNAAVYARVAAILQQGANVTLTPNSGTQTVSIAASGGGGGGGLPDFTSGYGNFGIYPQYPGSTTMTGFMMLNTAPVGTSAPTLSAPSTSSLGGLGYYHRLKFTAAAATDYIAWRPGVQTGYIGGTGATEPVYKFRCVFAITDGQTWSGTNGGRNFIGISWQQGASLSNTLIPSQYLTNCLGFYTDATDQYYRPIANSATANAAFLGTSLGAGFEGNPAPANDAAATVYDFQLKYTPGANRKAEMWLYNRTANSVAFVTLTNDGAGGTVNTGGKLPDIGAQIYPLLFRCNNGATTPVAPVLQSTGLFGGALTGIA
jgi:hypothetical protein